MSEQLDFEGQDTPPELQPESQQPEPKGNTGKPEPQEKRKGLPKSVRVVQAPTPMRLEGGDPNAKGPWIKYVGVATVRIMTPQDWKDAGVDSNKNCQWSYMNKKRLPRSIFTDQELQYLLRVDGRFALVDE